MRFQSYSATTSTSTTTIRYTRRLEFAAGSAKQSEIDRFGLRPGDVLITKDSETPDDIAVPALVVQGADDLVCGYHLALLRPNPSRLNGKFLFYALKSRVNFRPLFSVLAQGITRFGLTLSGIGSVAIPLPDLPGSKGDRWFSRPRDRPHRSIGREETALHGGVGE